MTPGELIGKLTKPKGAFRILNGENAPIEYPFWKRVDLDPIGTGVEIHERLRETMDELLRAVSKEWSGTPVEKVQINVTMRNQGIFFWLEAEVKEVRK